MKAFCKTILIVGFVLTNAFGIQAQTTDNKLNQVDLMKKFVGRWKCELGKDTVIISDNIAFGAIQNDNVVEEITISRIKENTMNNF